MRPMETRKIPETDLEVSRPALGCMGWGGGWVADTELTNRPRAASPGIPGCGRGDRREFPRPCQYLRSRQGRRCFRPGVKGKTVPQGQNRAAVEMRDWLGGRSAPEHPTALTSLVDKQANADQIEKTLVEMPSKPDTFVLFLAGHGTTLDEEYYFMPWELEYENDDSRSARLKFEIGSRSFRRVRSCWTPVAREALSSLHPVAHRTNKLSRNLFA